MLPEIILIMAGIYLAWSLGANDTANIVSTAIGAKILSFRQALTFLLICLILGALFFSKEIITTIQSGLVQNEVITIKEAIIALLITAIWVHFSTWKKWPVSTGQAIVSAIFGIGLAQSLSQNTNFIHWEKILSLTIVWLLSPLIGFLVSWLSFKLMHTFVRHRHLYLSDKLFDLITHPFRTIIEWFSGKLKRREMIFKGILLISSGYLALALGANTVASTTGLVYSGIILSGPQFLNNLWLIKLIVLGGVILGIVTYGHRLGDFLATSLIKLNPLRGFIIQSSTATIILIASAFGYPLSITGVFIGSFLGLNHGETHTHLKFKAIQNLQFAFLVTMPLVAVTSGIIEWLT